MKSAVLAALIAAASAQQSYISYSTVTGYFLQDLTSTNTSGFDYTAVNFGLINQTYPGVSSTGRTQWQQFRQVVNDLNENTPDDTVYKLFWFGRHGEGYHNAAESFYGTPAWNCYWSELDGNATATWADADLTPNGIRQAQIANAFWKSQIANQKIPFPQAYYTSPLTRCLRTANLTFSDIPTPKYYPFVPKVKEFFREGISTHTCDRRSNKTYIHNRFPTYTFEEGFTEKDELWNVNYAETSAAQDSRSKAALDAVFTADDHTYVSVTSHSGEIASLLRVLGHRAFSLSTGAVIPVLVKGVFLPAASAPAVSSAPARTSSAYCLNAPPVTSISGGACVCSGASTGLVGSSTRTTSGSASTGAVGSKTSTLSAKATGSAGVTKSAVLPSASTSKPLACKSKSKKTKKSKSKSAASTGAIKASSSNSRIASTGGIKPSSSNSRVASTGGVKVSISNSKAGSATVTKSTVVPSGASTSKPLACKSKSKTSKKSKSKSAASTGAVKASSSNSKVASTGVVQSSGSSKSAVSTGAVRSSSTLSSSSKPAGTTGAVRLSSSNSKPAASTGVFKPSSSKPKVCKTRSKTKTLPASTSGAVKPSSPSSGLPTTGAVKTSTLSTSIIRSGSSVSTSAVVSSSSTGKTSGSAGPVQSSSSAPASSKSSSASSAKPSSTAASSKISSAASSTITSSASRASVTVLSTSKARVCKTRTYASYYNEYRP